MFSKFPIRGRRSFYVSIFQGSRKIWKKKKKRKKKNFDGIGSFSVLLNIWMTTILLFDLLADLQVKFLTGKFRAKFLSSEIFQIFSRVNAINWKKKKRKIIREWYNWAIVDKLQNRVTLFSFQLIIADRRGCAIRFRRFTHPRARTRGWQAGNGYTERGIHHTYLRNVSLAV